MFYIVVKNISENEIKNVRHSQNLCYTIMVVYELKEINLTLQWAHSIPLTHASWSEYCYWLRILFYLKGTGLYRDGGEILFRKTSPRNLNRPRKGLIKFFKDHELKIATSNAKVIKFLDMTLDLKTGNYKPYTEDLHSQK